MTLQERLLYLRGTPSEDYAKLLAEAMAMVNALELENSKLRALERENAALRKLYEVVIAHNRAGAAWGEQFGDLMFALGEIHAIDAAMAKR